MPRLLLLVCALLLLSTTAVPGADPTPPRWVGSPHGAQQEEVLAWARREFAEEPASPAALDRAFPKWVKQYAALHSAIVQRRAPAAAQRFVVWRCSASKRCSGWGNRVTGLVSALAFAVLSDRALVIEWPDAGALALENLVKSDVIDWRVPEWLAHRRFLRFANAGRFGQFVQQNLHHAASTSTFATLI